MEEIKHDGQFFLHHKPSQGKKQVLLIFYSHIKPSHYGTLTHLTNEQFKDPTFLQYKQFSCSHNSFCFHYLKHHCVDAPPPPPFIYMSNLFHCPCCSNKKHILANIPVSNIKFRSITYTFTTFLV
jgi:hypothetical protein